MAGGSSRYLGWNFPDIGLPKDPERRFAEFVDEIDDSVNDNKSTGVANKNSATSNLGLIHDLEDRVDLLDVTTAAQTIHVDGLAGDDVTGDGTEALPYATYTRADQDVPYAINHKIHILIHANGETDDIEESGRVFRHHILEDGGYFVESAADMKVIQADLVADAVAEIGSYYAAHSWTHSAGGLVEDDYRHQFAQLTSGAESGAICAIYRNSAAGEFVLQGNYVYPSNGDTFSVVDCPIRLRFPDGATWVFTYENQVNAHGMRFCQVGFGGIQFESTKTDASLGDFVFTSGGNPCYLALACCSFNARGHNSYAVSFQEIDVNNADLDDATAFNSAQFNDWFDWCFTVATNNNHLTEVNETAYVVSSTVVGMCSRGKIEAAKTSRGAVGLYYSAVGQWRPWRTPGSECSGCYIDELGTAIHGIKAYAGRHTVDATYVASATDGIQVMEAAELILGDYYECHATGVTGHALRVGACGRVMIRPSLSGTLPSGATGDIAFEQAGTVAWPAAGAGANDALGAFVSRE